MAVTTLNPLGALADAPIDAPRLAQMLETFTRALAARDETASLLPECPPAELDLVAWGRTFLPEHFSLPPSMMHRWLTRQLDLARAKRGGRLNVIGPRGGAKSTLASLAYPLRCALEGSEPYIWIVSDTRDQAAAHLENIKLELANNRLLQTAYPGAAGKGDVWRRGAIVLQNGATIEAYGTGQRIRGRRHKEHRPSLIVCDDLENDRHMESPLAREKSHQWFHGTLLKAGTTQTNIVCLATALHRDALALSLNRTPGWKSRVFKAVARWPRHQALWEEWEAIYARVDNPQAEMDARRFYEERRSEMEEGALVLWPEAEDLYALMCMRAVEGRSAFEREKQGSPINPDLCEWPESYFDEGIWFDTWPSGLVAKTLALDPSKGTDAKRGDYSAFVLLGVSREGVLYIEADLARRSTPQIVVDGVALYRRFRPDAFGVEANQFQDLLADQFADEFRRQDVLGVRPWTLENRVPKAVRIRRFGPYLASKRVRFKSDSPATRLLVEQFAAFPIGGHDDGPDAAEMALRLAIDLLGRRRPHDNLGNRLEVES